jgi:hypothetical protein
MSNIKVNKMSKCDICTSTISAHQGYIVNTKTIVTDSGYWERLIDLADRRGAKIPTTPFEILQMVVLMARQRNSWIVCEKCSEIYQFDKENAKKVAETWWENKEPVFCDPLCSISEGGRKINYSDKDAFDLAYSNARGAFSKYWLRQLQQFNAEHKATPQNARKSTMLRDLSFDCVKDIRESGQFG